MPADHVDVLIVGAGLSGIGAACQLRRRCPDKTFTILEARDAVGGTWDLFRYPGVRSDSDMLTLGYGFRPWTEPRTMADGAAIRAYIRDTAQEYGVADRIRFRHRAVRAEWSSETARWTVVAHRPDDAAPVVLTCAFLFVCTGYYRYDQGYTPHWPGLDRFAGTVVHPQHWPDGLDYTGKRVLVIGSGATAVTLVPAMAATAAHVTMLQRSPSYVMALPSHSGAEAALRRTLPPSAAYRLARWRNVLLTQLFYRLSRRWPRLVKALLRKAVRAQLPPDYPVDVHFAPRYDPWEQRMCFVPDGDLFAAVRSGRASIVTDRIESFTPTGVRLASGGALPADVVVTATGLNLLAVGGMTVTVDGAEVDVAQTVAYKGVMLSGVPNLAVALGYTNASWTLKCSLAAEYVCRLLRHMDQRGYRACTPVVPGGPVQPIIDLTSGYVLRSIDVLPRQGLRPPWRLHQNYPRDVLLLRHGRIEDGGLRFSRGPVPAAAA